MFNAVLGYDLSVIMTNIFSFMIIISSIVFIHEFGHFYFARLFGVKVEIFSIGFGKPIVKWQDKKGTEWRIAMLPFGGYIKMFGDDFTTSNPDINKIENMTQNDMSVSFHHKKLWQKAIIVAAGPIFNYLLAITIIFGLTMYFGMNIVSPEVTSVIEGSPADIAGIEIGDIITNVDNTAVKDFQEIKNLVMLSNGKSLLFSLNRGENHLNIEVQPSLIHSVDSVGTKVAIPLIGIHCAKSQHYNTNLLESMISGINYSYNTSIMMLKVMGQMLKGEREFKELSGPIKIAQYSGKSFDSGIENLMRLIAIISLNLGLVNLMPIPMLDGGHLLYYAIQSAYGKPMSINLQMIGFKIGFVIIVTLIIFGIVNDLRSIFGF